MVKIYVSHYGKESTSSNYLAAYIENMGPIRKHEVMVVDQAADANLLIVEDEKRLPANLRTDQRGIIVNIQASDQKTSRPNVDLVPTGRFNADFWKILEQYENPQPNPSLAAP